MKKEIFIGVMLSFIVGTCFGLSLNTPSKAMNVPVIEREVYIDEPDTLCEWETLMMAIMGVESEYNETPKDNGKYYGCLQISQIYVDEINRKLGTFYTIDDAMTMDGALDLLHAMNDIYNLDKDIDTAIYLHNKSSNYKNRVKKRMKEIEKYENFRRRLKEYYSEY